MTQSTIERPVIEAPTAPTVAAPLTEAEVDSLLELAASTEKTARVHAPSRMPGARAWSRGGDVD